MTSIGTLRELDAAVEEALWAVQPCANKTCSGLAEWLIWCCDCRRFPVCTHHLHRYLERMAAFGHATGSCNHCGRIVPAIPHWKATS